MDKPNGMRSDAFHAWLTACERASISPDRITHTLDTQLHKVVLSGQTHMESGTFQGEVYTACFDIHLTDLAPGEILRLESELYKVGIIGWWRRRPWWFHSEHGHFMYLNCHLNQAQREQAHDWFASRDGLVNHLMENHAPVTQQTVNDLRAMFLSHNPMSD